MKTESIKKKDINRDWHLIDASGKTLGRLSSKIATILRGKNKVNYSPNIDMSDFVVIINADKIKVTGNKEDAKAYWRHSGFPGGTQTKLYKTLDSKFIITNSVKGMLPHNRLGRKLINHLKIYNGNSHPHESQNPKLMEI